MSGVNETSIFLWEYNRRKSLAKLGVTFPALSVPKAEIFAIIDEEIRKLEDAEAKKQRRR
jgi:hypothetical protein